MSGIRMYEEQLRIMTPHTYNALTKLVMAMADYTKDVGKSTIFGRDKGQKAYSKFLFALKVTLQSMVIDEIVGERVSTDVVLDKFLEKFEKFKLAHPQWPDAYAFGGYFFGEKREDAIAIVERLRSVT